MTYDEMIQIIQAAKAGAQIQFSRDGIEWQDYSSNLPFNFYEIHYRVKPESINGLFRIKIN